MRFDWDDESISRIARHDVTPAEVIEAFLNAPVEFAAYFRNGEERLALAGVTNAGRVIYVVYTLTANGLRPVTAFESRKHRPLFEGR